MNRKGKELEDEVEKLEAEQAVLDSEIKASQSRAEEERQLHKAATDEKVSLEEQIKQKTLLLEGLELEKGALVQSLIEERKNVKAEIESLEVEAREAKDRHSKLSETLAKKEIESKRVKKELSNMESVLEKELEEVKSLENMKKGDVSGGDSILREKEETQRKMDTLNEKTNVAKSMAGEISKEINLLEEGVQSNKKLIKEKEERVYSLSEQHAHMVKLVSEKTAQSELLRKSAVEMEAKRVDMAAAIEEREQYLTNTVLRELKEILKSRAQIDAKLQAARKEESDKSAILRDLELSLQDKLSRLKQATTQREFLSHKIASDTDTIAKLQRDLNEILRAQALIKSREKSILELEKIQSENEQLQLEADKLDTEIRFMHEHKMLGADGRLQPLRIDPEDNAANELVKKLGINEFLIHAQSEPEVYKTNLMLVEKISQLLELIHNAETLEAQYQRDAERSREMVKQLSEKNSGILHEIEDLKSFAHSALVQIGLNQIRGTTEERSKSLILNGLGYSDSDFGKLTDSLELDEKGRIETICLSNNKLVEFDFSLLMTDFVRLRNLDVRGNALESLNEFERFLRNKVDGITGVYRDDKIIIVNSGLQVRLTVNHGEVID